MVRIIFRVIFWCSVSFIAIFLWTITFGQTVNYEFRNHKIANHFYNIILGGIPIAMLLTLFGTLKKCEDKKRRIFTIFATIVLTALTIMVLLDNLFTIGFGIWTTFNIAYEHKADSEQQIREQRYDVGAFGYAGDRVVEVKPFAKLFWKVTPVDTTKIDKTEWKRVDKEADIKFP